MCGIFGILQKNKTEHAEKMLSELFTLSESRGKEASGLAIEDLDSINVLKTAFPASDLVKNLTYKEAFKNNRNNCLKIIGHSRLVTNGDENNNNNNQPVIRNGMVVVHNGIITNHKELWNTQSKDSPTTALDSELIPVLLNEKLTQGSTISEALSYLYKTIYGMTTIAVLFEDKQELMLATNNGSLYYLWLEKEGFFVFASERHILNQFCNSFKSLQPGKEPTTWDCPC